jgi:hypothetical protein
MTDRELLKQIASRLQSNFAQYLLSPGGFQSNLDLPENQRLSNQEREFLDLVREDATGLTASDLVPFLRAGNEAQDIPALTQILTPVEEAARPTVEEAPPEPVQRQVIVSGEVQPGLVSTTRIGEGAPAVRPAPQRAEPTGPVAGPGGEWSYDTLTSQPVFIEEGQPLPTRIDPATYRGPIKEAGVTPTVEEPAEEPAGEGDDVATTPAAEPVDMGVPSEWETAAMEMYPEYYALVKNVPEIANLLKQYLGDGGEWSETKFLAELRKTNWYKTTTASAREWDMAAGLDPATYQTKVDNKTETIRKQALDLGFRISEEKLRQLALDSLRLGWSDQFLTNAIGMVVVEGGDPGATQLRQGYYGQQIRGIARDYGVTLNDDTLMSFANKMAVGEETVGSFQDYAMTIAKSLYPTLSEQFDLGRTFGDLTSNYRQIAADTLEIDANSIDFTDPQWAVAVTYQPDPKTGEQRMMNLSEWGDYIRKNRSFGYEYTDDAKQKAYKVANELANLFGKV